MALIAACSFDVFDTCLVRTVASGTHLLAEAARRSAVGSQPLDEETVAEAVRLRVAGEARAAGVDRDAVLAADAYAAVPQLGVIGVDAERMLAEELRLEREGLRPVQASVARIAQVRAEGRQVVFVSDMHLPASLLRDALEEHGMAEPGDRVFVSGEVGVSKLSGRMYDHVLRELSLRPDQLLHRGDDAWTDVHMARTRGVRVDPFPEGRLHRYERAVLDRGPGPLELRSRSAALSRFARLAEPLMSADARLAAALGAGVVGPLLTGYVRWVLDDARERGVASLGFVSRDGQVLYEIARRIRQPGDPECQYLYGSRQAWFLAGLAGRPDMDLSWVFEPLHERASVRSVLAKVGLRPEEVVDDLRAVGLGADDPVDLGAPGACGVLVERVRPQVLVKARQAQTSVCDYLGERGLLDGRPWAIVDVGWYLNAQTSLRRALGGDVAMSGYYLAVRARRRPLVESGPYRARVREDEPGDRERLDGGWLLDVPNLVEHVFVRADHGQCVGYARADGTVQPVLREARPTPSWFPVLRSAALRYAEGAQAAGLLDDGGRVAFAAGDTAGRLFALQPTREEAVLFGGTLVSDDHNESGLRPLAPPLGVADVRMRVRRRLGRAEDGAAFWQHWAPGTWAASPPAVRATVTTVRAAVPLARTLRARWRRVPE